MSRKRRLLGILGHSRPLGFGGTIGLGVVAPLAARDLFREDLSRHLLLPPPSLIFCTALAMQQIAYADTTVTNASFLVNTTVLFTPIVAWQMIRERPNAAGILGAILAIFGVGFMAGALDGIAWGDAACPDSALLHSIWIVQVTQAMRQAHRPSYQFIAAALLGLFLSLAWEATTLSAPQNAIPELIILGVFSTGAAFALQAKAQRWAPGADPAVLMAAESLFGALAAALFLDERPRFARSIGAAMIIGAVISVQWGQQLFTAGASRSN